MDLETTLYAPAPSWTSNAIDRAIRHSLFPKAPANVLDLGSGNGRIVKEFAKRGYNAYGIEIDEELTRQSLQNTANTIGNIKIAHGNYLPKEFRAKLKPAPHLFLNGKDAYEILGIQPKDFDAFFIYPYPEQMHIILQFFKKYARKDAVLMALGDEVDWMYNEEPQLTHLGTIKLPETRRYTLFKKSN